MSNAGPPIVLRFESVHPRDLGGIRMHALRAGGDVSHTDGSEPDPLDTFVGGSSWVEDLRAEIDQVADENLEVSVAALTSKGKKKQASKRRREGSKKPFRESRSGGPLREAVLTVDGEWFRRYDGLPDAEKVREFGHAAVSFFEKNFPGQVRHLRADLDEGSLHFHAVLAPWATSITKNGASQRLLTPSRHPLFNSYEAAQDAAGEHFAAIGLSRGSRDAQARREAREQGLPVPPKRRHVSPRAHRRELAQREAALNAREIELDVRSVGLTDRARALELESQAIQRAALAVVQDAERLKKEDAIQQATHEAAERAKAQAKREAIAKAARAAQAQKNARAALSSGRVRER